MIKKQYLGDGLYAEYNDYGQFVLSSDDGAGTTNIMYLEPEVLDSFYRYVDHVKRELNKGDEK